MPNWLTKATAVVSRDTEEVPQEFVLSCECGQLHRGHRKSRAQRIICQTCGAALFILPRNVYPVLKPQTSKRRRKRRARRGELFTLGGFTRAIGRGTATAGLTIGRATQSAGRAVERQVVGQLARFAQFLRAQLTPFRLVILGILVMVTGTGAWVLHNRRLEAASETLRVEFLAGEEALDEGDIESAFTHFEKAAVAADRLQSTDTRSLQAKQMLHETTAMSRLCSASLLDILEEAERVASGDHAEFWENRFRGTYAGTWIVLEAPIYVRRDSDEGPFVEIEFPLVVGDSDRRVTLTADVPDTAGLGDSTDPQPSIFAAELTSCLLDDSTDEWHVRLSGRTGFLWSDPENLQRLGFFDSEWVDEEQTRELLHAQSESLGIH